MFPRLAAVVLVASSFLSGAVAGPVPAPTPAPIPVEQRDVGDFFRSIVSEGGNVWDDITGVAGDIATFVTSVGGEGFTFITDIGGSAYQLATSGADDAFVVVTSVGGQAYTVVKDEFANKPTSTPTTTKNAASPLRPIGVSLPLTVSLVSTIVAIGLGAQSVL